jgi:hypothetical protein
MTVGPGEVYDRVASLLPDKGRIERAELVGLAPWALLEAEGRNRWSALGLSEATTIEYRVTGHSN